MENKHVTDAKGNSLGYQEVVITPNGDQVVATGQHKGTVVF